MKVISIINLKGGVGKTVTTIQLADALTQAGKRVLLIDNDKQGNLSKFYKQYRDLGFYGTASILKGDYLNCIAKTQNANIDIVPTNINLLLATIELQKAMPANMATKIKSFIEFHNNSYDYVLIDNAPDIGINTINALVATNEVIVPLKVDEWSMSGLDFITEQIEEAKKINSSIKLLGALITVYRNNDANAAGIEWLKKKNYKLFNTKIRYSAKVDESIFFHSPLREYSPTSAATVDYKRFYNEYITLTTAEKKGV